MTYIQIGNITISSLWLAVFLGLSTAYLFLRFVLRRPLHDWYWNAFFLYFIIWKFSYIVFEFPMFVKTPLSALYFSGGIRGHILAISIVIVYLFLRMRKKDSTFKREGLNVLILFFISFEFIYHLLEQNLFVIYAQILLIILGVGIHIFWKRQGKQNEKVLLLLLFFGQLVIKILFQTFFSTTTWTFSLLALLFFIFLETKEKKVEIWNLKQFRLPFLALIAFSILFLLLQPSFPDGGVEAKGTKTEKAAVGYLAPDFELTTLDGKTVRLSDYRGKKLIVNFWASWCPPCRSEMPHMQAFYEKQNQNQIEILAVNLTTKDDGIEKVQQFVSDFGLTFPIPSDEEGKVGKIYPSVSIPTSYFIDSKGIIRGKIVGPMDQETMKKMIKHME
ncbi:TlpA disulfide reductase family protein [Fervidibacillus halotolerans]|uniref:TlpA family protein disulfide reductase n=1 Tax=Fervidibacillus halotolerans TaxID=2980027 RepID=A0A9E8S1H7_9BACI|nr:TlpA disulfide reductase family protein [Fervidibacillus halotolerans]WAA13532.1 TlpA family protein disulfide reductase [Fervidibacillus halotolerans]